MLHFACTIFLSAFLLFQVQPLIARLILPWFGGSAAVWATCMLFFQVVLLLGYLYAHWLTNWLSPARQAQLHMGLLALSLLVLPIMPNPAWKPSGAANPTLGILGLLAVTVGLPYLLLSTTGPLVQAWYARVTHGRLPYRLFALSNFASLLALLSYPPLVEPYLASRTQAIAWSAGYALFAALAALAGLRTRRRAALPAGDAIVDSAAGPSPSAGERLMWIALPACASAMLLAVTNHLTQDVASIPFLWILPLALYLLSFVLSFDAAGWYRRWPFMVALALALSGMTYRLWSDEYLSELKPTIILYSAGFFVCCMFCHGELSRRKPHPRHLTSFYLMMSLGGALGGVFVAVAAPYFFAGNFELPISIALCILLALHVLFHEAGSPFRQGRLIWAWCLFAAIAAGNMGILVKVVREWTAGARVVTRNFYGGLRVSDEDGGDDEPATRKLMHGNINHGEQRLDPSLGKEPTTYYCRDSGVGLALMEARTRSPVRAGLIGLGAGTLAAYGLAGDYFRFYEINPSVIRLATTEFSYTRDSAARIEFALGDARLSLEREAPQQFDVLAVDAFSGDSIPVHLLTREAFALYFRHLKPDGVLAVHISNRYLDLRPVVRQAALAFGKPAREIDTEDNDSRSCFGCTWVLVTGQRGYFGRPAFELAAPLKATPVLPIWTDDYSNLFRILK
ncbi:MAG: fused MFS/spermidine synthase [Acidobacteria bacterium]|nr:fused MFS/spermidine synthase [Acidobacteriota bacterium]